MGMHKHVRVVVDGNKNHSTGAGMRQYILDELIKYHNQVLLHNNNLFGFDNKDFLTFLHNQNGVIASSTEYTKFNAIKEIRFIFIKRHMCHKNRTIQFMFNIKLRNGIIRSIHQIHIGIKCHSDDYMYKAINTLSESDIEKYRLFQAKFDRNSVVL